MNGPHGPSVSHIALFSAQRLQREAVRRSLSRADITVDLYAANLDGWRDALAPLAARVCLLDATLLGFDEAVKELPKLGFTVVILTQLGALEAIYQAVTSGDVKTLNPPSIDDSGELHGAQRFVLQLERILAAPRRAPMAMPDSKLGRNNHASASTPQILAIGASTGGPAAIRTLLNALERPIPYAVLVVQHIDADFAQGFCDWLQSECQLPTHFARAFDWVQAGHVYVAPPGRHLSMTANGQLALQPGRAPDVHMPDVDMPDVHMPDVHIPSVDQLFASLALQAKLGLAVLLTGMGEDGASALRLLRDRGWQTFAQDADSAVVHGMPGAAIALGAAAHILKPAAIGKYLSSPYHDADDHAALRVTTPLRKDDR